MKRYVTVLCVVGLGAAVWLWQRRAAQQTKANIGPDDNILTPVIEKLMRERVGADFATRSKVDFH